jgi:hypothetical protein
VQHYCWRERRKGAFHPYFLGIEKIFNFFQSVEKSASRNADSPPLSVLQPSIRNACIFVSLIATARGETPSNTFHGRGNKLIKINFTRRGI